MHLEILRYLRKMWGVCMSEKKPKLAENEHFVLSSALLLGGGLLFHYIPAVALGVGAIGYMIYDYANELLGGKDVKGLQKLFENCGLANRDSDVPKVLRKGENSIGPIYTLQIPVGLSQKDFKLNQDVFQSYFNAPVKITQGSKMNQVDIQVLTNNFKPIYPIRLDELTNDMKGMRFVLGVKQSVEGEVVAIIDYDKVEGHILISGGTGSGKSTVLRLIYAQAIMKGWAIHALDAKSTEAGVFRNYEKMTLSIEPERAMEHLVKLHQLMKQRNDLLYKSHCKDYRSYNAKNREDTLFPILVIIDEFSPYRKNKDVKQVLSSLLSIGRSAGIYIILSTQRIDSQSMADLKTNLGIRITLKTETEADSGIALGGKDARAYYLPGNGRGYLKYGSEHNVLIQSFFLDEQPCLQQLYSYLQGECIHTSYDEYEVDVMSGISYKKVLKKHKPKNEKLAPFVMEDGVKQVDKMQDSIQVSDYFRK